jgi:PAS domain S-box-containing protein
MQALAEPPTGSSGRHASKGGTRTSTTGYGIGPAWPLVLAAIAVVALGTSSYHYVGRSNDIVEERLNSGATLLHLERLLLTLQAAVAGQRGYVITGRPAYLAPYADAGKRLTGELIALEGLVAGQPEQMASLRALRPDLEAVLADLSRTIELRRQGQEDEARALVTSDHGHYQMARINEEVARMRVRASSRRDADRVRHLASVRTSFVLVVGGSAVLFLLTAYATMSTARELRARGRAERAAQHRGERYRSLVDASSQVVWTADRTGQMTGDHTAWSALTGQSSREAEGHGWLNAVHAEERSATRAAWLQSMETGVAFSWEHRVRRQDGLLRTFSVRVVPVFDDKAAIREWVGVHTDITERKRAEERLRFLAEVSTLLAAPPELPSALSKVAALSVPTFADASTIDLCEPSANPKRVAQTRHNSDGGAAADPSPGGAESEALVEVCRTGNGRLLEIESASGPSGAAFVRSLMLVPWQVRGQVAGVLTWTCEESRRRFSQDDLAFGREVAARMGAAIDRMRLLAETEEARRLLDAIFEAAPIGLALFDADLRLSRINAALVAVTGQTTSSAAGQPAATLFEGTLPALEGLLTETLRAHRAIEREVRGTIDENGDERVWLIRCAPVAGGVIALFIDISGRKRVEAEREGLVRALARSNEDLNQFAYVASHDLKAPLRGITHLSEWLEEDLGDAIPEPAREKLALLRGRARRLEGLIDGILDYSRAGRARAAASKVDVRALLRDVVDLLGGPAAASVVIAAVPFPALLTDRAALQQVFMNLISNAIKHGSDAATGQLQVEVSATPSDDQSIWTFTVADNGPGIAPDYHERIWGIFQTLQSRDKIEGAGIGLSIVKKIVEAQGGQVWIESVPGQGARFSFTWLVREIPRRDTPWPEVAWKEPLL